MRPAAAVIAALALMAGCAAAAPAALEAPCSYVVNDGDSLYNIADKYGLKAQDLEAVNDLADSSLIQPGDIVRLPCAGDAEEGSSILDLLSRRNDTTVLFAAVVAADLAETLNDTKLEVTLFAPNDTAFGVLLEALNLTAADVLSDKPLLLDLLQYHVLPEGALKAADLTDGLNVTTMLDDEWLVASKPKDVLRMKTTTGQRIRVTVANMEGGKSVVHLTKKVFVPESAPIDAPADDDECVHVVAPDETLFVIAQEYGLTTDELLSLNPKVAADPNSLQIGTELVLYDSCI